MRKDKRRNTKRIRGVGTEMVHLGAGTPGFKSGVKKDNGPPISKRSVGRFAIPAKKKKGTPKRGG